jgi:hypothetical protein
VSKNQAAILSDVSLLESFAYVEGGGVESPIQNTPDVVVVLLLLTPRVEIQGVTRTMSMQYSSLHKTIQSLVQYGKIFWKMYMKGCYGG